MTKKKCARFRKLLMQLTAAKKGFLWTSRLSASASGTAVSLHDLHRIHATFGRGRSRQYLSMGNEARTRNSGAMARAVSIRDSNARPQSTTMHARAGTQKTQTR